MDEMDNMDEKGTINLEIERLWVAEAERRYQAYEQGLITAKPAEEAIREVRKLLRSKDEHER